jgi:protein-L-isoaspartate O-methyltransferase
MNKEKSTAFMLKVVSDLAAGLAVSLVHVGDRVGLFKAMAGAGALSSAALAERSGVRERYADEWLAAMYCAGYVEHDAQAETWTLPDEHAVFLSRPDSEYYLGGLFKGAPDLAAMAPRVAEAFETGEGISFQAYGAGTPLALEHMNRAVYETRLVKMWLPTMPQVVRALEAGGSAIDVGCGTGVIPVLLAQAYPQARITGLHSDARSIEIARENARRAGVANRVRFVVQSADDLQPADGGYDFISSFDCIHDLGDPQGVMSRMRRALAPGGTALLVEPRVGERRPTTWAIPSLACCTASVPALCAAEPGPRRPRTGCLLGRSAGAADGP